MYQSLGGKGIRTPGLLIANETLYQLSYTPTLRGPIISATPDGRQGVFAASLSWESWIFPRTAHSFTVSPFTVHRWPLKGRHQTHAKTQIHSDLCVLCASAVNPLRSLGLGFGGSAHESSILLAATA